MNCEERRKLLNIFVGFASEAKLDELGIMEALLSWKRGEGEKKMGEKKFEEWVREHFEYVENWISGVDRDLELFRQRVEGKPRFPNDYGITENRRIAICNDCPKRPEAGG